MHPAGANPIALVRARPYRRNDVSFPEIIYHPLYAGPGTRPTFIPAESCKWLMACLWLHVRTRVYAWVGVDKERRKTLLSGLHRRVRGCLSGGFRLYFFVFFLSASRGTMSNEWEGECVLFWGYCPWWQFVDKLASGWKCDPCGFGELCIMDLGSGRWTDQWFRVWMSIVGRWIWREWNFTCSAELNFEICNRRF